MTETTPATAQTPDLGDYKPVDLDETKRYFGRQQVYPGNSIAAEGLRCCREITYLRAQVARQDAAIGELVGLLRESIVNHGEFIGNVEGDLYYDFIKRRDAAIERQVAK